MESAGASPAVRRRGWRRGEANVVIAIHGGAGTITRTALRTEREETLRAALAASLAAGAQMLRSGATSLDAVEQAVRAMEDSPLFNAGRGAVFTASGTIELDACIMEGASLRAGAVAAVRGVRNPVSLARVVMERSPHVLLAAEGAAAFARAHGIAFEPEAYFHTPERWEALQRLRAGKAATTDQDRHGTVGAVALDAAGRLAAATSTGGLTGKLPGRVGDTPIVGAGTYADASVAISGTGDGEVFLRCNAAYRVAALMQFAGVPVEAAARRALAEVSRRGGRGGLIALARTGTLSMPFTTEGMYRGVCRGDEKPRVAIHRERLR